MRQAHDLPGFQNITRHDWNVLPGTLGGPLMGLFPTGYCVCGGMSRNGAPDKVPNCR